MSMYREFVRKNREGRLIIKKIDKWDEYTAGKIGSPCHSLSDTPREAMDDYYKTEKQYLIELENDFEKDEIPLLKGTRISYDFDWFIHSDNDFSQGDTLDEAIDDLFNSMITMSEIIDDIDLNYYWTFKNEIDMDIDRKTDLHILNDFWFANTTTEKMFDGGWLYLYMTELDEEE